MFLTNFIFVVSHLRIHPAVHLNVSLFLCSNLCQKKDKMVSCIAPGCANRADKNSDMTLVTIIMLLQLYCGIFRTLLYLQK